MYFYCNIKEISNYPEFIDLFQLNVIFFARFRNCPVEDHRIFREITVFSALNYYIIFEPRFQSPYLNSVYFPLSHRSFFSLRGLSDLLLFPTLSAQIS